MGGGGSHASFITSEVRNIVNNDFSVQELGKVELHQTGIDRLLSLINLDPTNEKAYFNLGMITMDEVMNIVAFTPLPLSTLFPSHFLLFCLVSQRQTVNFSNG